MMSKNLHSAKAVALRSLLVFPLLLACLLPRTLGAQALQVESKLQQLQTAIRAEPPPGRVFVALNQLPTAGELERLAREAGVPAVPDIRGVLIGEIGFPEDRQQLETALRQGSGIIICELKGHIIYPPLLASYNWYNCILEVMRATLFR